MTKLEKERTEEINALIKEMTLEEKVGLMLHESIGIPRLGIKDYNWWNECLHGVAKSGATVFPQTIGLAATFNLPLAKEEYEAISDEARAKYNESQKINENFNGLTFWTPNINIFRDPRWGRGQETFGEDPCLTTKMGVVAVESLQGDDSENLKVAACAKHFAVHSGPESTRHTANINPSKKDLWETYLPSFKALVDANVESVMGAYQRLYGEPCNGSKFLLVDILRKKWGFKGHVVSDCWAVRDFHENHKVTKTAEESATLAINSGCDLNCGCTYHSAINAVKQGILSEEKINESVFRLLMTRMKLGMFDSWEKSKWANLGKKDLNSQKNRELAKKVATESIVLLKNKNGLLPLKNDVKKIAVMGPVATNVDALVGNYNGINSNLVTILSGILAKSESSPNLSVDYTPGVGMYHESKQRGWTLGLSERVDVVIACFGLDSKMEGEEGAAIETTRGDRDFIELPKHQLDYLQAIHDRGTPVVLVLTGGAPISIPYDIADAILFAWYPGEEGGNAVADIIFGETSPSGHLPVTFPKSTTDLPPFDDYSMKDRTYRYATKEPLFPFGFGLTYTQFFIKNAKAKKTDKNVKVECEVQNIGKIDAKEVIQVYVSKVKRTDDDPLCSLRDFKKVFIKSGKTKKIDFELPLSAFETITSEGESVVENGEYFITISDAVPTQKSQELGATKPEILKIEI